MKKDPNCVKCGAATRPFPSTGGHPAMCPACIKAFRAENGRKLCAKRDYDDTRKHFSRTCASCGKSFSVKGRINSGTVKHCSDECYRASISARSNASNMHTAASYEKRSKTMAGVPKTHPTLRKGNVGLTAKAFQLVSPDGVDYQGVNVSEFIRSNPGLFAPEDVIFHQYKKSTGPRALSHHCRALGGLLSVLSGRRGSWKGWTVRTSHLEDKRGTK